MGKTAVGLGQQVEQERYIAYMNTTGEEIK